MKGDKFPLIDFSKFILPLVDLKICKRNGVFKIFDPLRKDYFILTEEELVRQSFVNWLINDLGYPMSLMANEKGLRLNGCYKRCDTILYYPSGLPRMIIEYKSPNITINQETFNQIVKYNMALKAEYLVVSNGNINFCCRVDYATHSIEFITKVPSYSELSRG